VHRGRQRNRFFHHSAVEHRQHAGQPRAYRADIGIRRVAPGIGFAGAEDLGAGIELDMGFQADDGFVLCHTEAPIEKSAARSKLILPYN